VDDASSVREWESCSAAETSKEDEIHPAAAAAATGTGA